MNTYDSDNDTILIYDTYDSEYYSYHNDALYKNDNELHRAIRNYKKLNIDYETYICIISSLITPDTIHSLDKDGNTPLHCIINQNHTIELIKLLLLHKADPNRINILGDTPLHCVITNSKDNIFINKRTHKQIEYNRRITISELLIKYGANINIQNKKGDTPMHCSIRNNAHSSSALHRLTNTSMHKFLIMNGANFNILNHKNYTPLEHYLLREEDKKDILDTLHLYNRKQFLFACKGFEQYHIGINALLLIGQHMNILPDKDLLDIILKKK